MPEKNGTRPDDLQNMVNSYDRMMKDPKKYAEEDYARQRASQGLAWGEWNGRDATQKANKKWPKGHIPV